MNDSIGPSATASVRVEVTSRRVASRTAHLRLTSTTIYQRWVAAFLAHFQLRQLCRSQLQACRRPQVTLRWSPTLVKDEKTVTCSPCVAMAWRRGLTPRLTPRHGAAASRFN